MTRVPLTTNFFLDEFICPEIYSERGAKSIALLDMRIVLACQYIRDHLGVVTVNNWINGGQYKESGLRSSGTRTGAKWSQHKYGRAADIKVKGYAPEKVFQFIKESEKYFIENQFITTVENLDSTPTWLHIDCRFTGLDHIQVVNP